MGYHTLVGALGSGLSGGQMRRVLLARALYKNPKVLALDEATSHRDIGNERAVTAVMAHLQLTRLAELVRAVGTAPPAAAPDGATQVVAG